MLIGNFALFGATGGRLFVHGEAGDRFAVRNSGATAVVEGVGNFACEYMTNGSVLNIGGFGKGVGNGMSGGFLYQYDPEGLLADRASADSIVLGSIIGDDPQAAIHNATVLQLLHLHVEATGSEKARSLIDNWQVEQHHFAYGMPRALLQYQDFDEILAAATRKELAGEVAAALVAHQVRKFKASYRSGTPVAGGVTPNGTDTEAMYALLNNYTVLAAAQEMALQKVPGSTGTDDPAVQKAARNLLLTEDFFLINKLERYALEAISGHTDTQLAALVADKRLTDYTQALALRNVRSVDAPGTYGGSCGRAARISTLPAIYPVTRNCSPATRCPVSSPRPWEFPHDRAFHSRRRSFHHRPALVAGRLPRGNADPPVLRWFRQRCRDHRLGPYPAHPVRVADG